MKRSVLVILLSGDEVLMIQKKKGQGAGLWNFPGGKCEEAESFFDAALRECFEETGLKPANLKLMAKINFFFPHGQHWESQCQVFMTHEFSGDWVQETQECSSHWIKVKKIPYASMWKDDVLWVPRVLNSEKLYISYSFSKEDEVDESIEHEVDF